MAVVQSLDTRMFCFSPYALTITGLTLQQKVELKFTPTTVEKSFVRYAGSSTMVIPIDGILQSFFKDTEFGEVTSGSSSPTMKIGKEIEVWIDDSLISTQTFDVIWGALQIGEVEPKEETIYRFGTLPLTLTQTIGNYVNDNDNSAIDDNLYSKTLSLIPYQNITQIQIVTGSTVKKTINIVNEESCDNSIYLRWIDQYGEYKYHSFKLSTSALDAKKGSTFNYNVLTLNSTANGLFKKKKQTKDKVVSKIIECGVIADDTMTTHLEGLLYSLKQWMYITETNKWAEVDIDDITISRKRNEGNREILVKVIPQEYFTQRL